jgi:hypothetical protein
MTETAERIMQIFGKEGTVEPGMVLSISELSRHAKEWGPEHAGVLEAAMKELQDEGYVHITIPHGLELTERGVSYLFAD